MPDTIQDQEVTPLELFFDLVFVFAITQVSSFVSDDATWEHLLEGVAILAVLWWAWVSYAWLGNTDASDDGAVRVDRDSRRRAAGARRGAARHATRDLLDRRARDRLRRARRARGRGLARPAPQARERIRHAG